MGGEFHFIEILIYAMLAGFLVYRLRSVLGRKHGEERERPNPFARPPETDAGRPDNVVPLPGRSSIAAPDTVEPPPLPGSAGGSLADGIRAIRANDSSFSDRYFLQGAKAAFEMIVAAFAAGDTATLRPLLGDDVYDRFAEAIRDRQVVGEMLDSRISGFEAVELLEARMEGRHAVCVVKIATRQINVTRDAAGDVVDGDADRAFDVVDLWTFSRNTRSTDPNWLLVETRTPN